ncbi:hypothetical protein [Spiroplasma corruscae]|uniref:hypothetical protein n=1 Tax=Spiroplasma corruscae TaxID=216934 RepID=UPI000B8BD11E|nr:hypothetical protein [Spiroplasma corruscae]
MDNVIKLPMPTKLKMNLGIVLELRKSSRDFAKGCTKSNNVLSNLLLWSFSKKIIGIMVLVVVYTLYIFIFI